MKNKGGTKNQQDTYKFVTMSMQSSGQSNVITEHFQEFMEGN